MHITLPAVAISMGVTAFSFFAGIGTVDVIQNIHKEPEPYRLDLLVLEYSKDEGLIHQHVAPVNIKSVGARWASKISRDGHIICSGGGKSNYDGTAHVFTPSEWTGDDCPELQAGDIASASWTYENINGFNTTEDGDFVID